MMNRLIITSFLLLAALLPNLITQAQTEKSLLWKIEGPDIKTSYVFGTIHLIPESDFLLRKKVLKAMKKSDQLVMEIDLSDPAMGKEMLKGVFMKNDSTLDQLLSPGDYQLLDSLLLASTGMGVNFYKRWKPLLVSSMIEPFPESDKTESYEMSLMSIAKEQKMEIGGLESVSEQLAVFDSIPYSLQAESMVDLLHNDEVSEDIIFKAIEYYKEESVDDLYEFSISYFESEVTRTYLLDQRNVMWIDRIGSMASEQKTFFAVGAAHLGGELGILQLLQSAGYKLTPIFD